MHDFSIHVYRSVKILKFNVWSVEYYPNTITSDIIGDSSKQDSVDSAALFNVEIKRPMSLERKQSRCKTLTQKILKRVGRRPNRFWALTSDKDCETTGDRVTFRVWLTKTSHQWVSVFFLQIMHIQIQHIKVLIYYTHTYVHVS